MYPISINVLPQNQIEKYAKSYKRNDKLFSEEENKCESQLRELENESYALKRGIKELGVKEDPGHSPDYEPYVKPLCKWVGWLWGISLVLMFIFHCLIWVVKLIFDIPWDTWGWTKSCFLYGLYCEILCFLGGSIVYGIVYWYWNKRKEAFTKWETELESLKSELSLANSNIKKVNQSLKNIIINRQNILTYAFKSRLSLPMRSIPTNDLKKAHNTLFKFLDEKEALDSISDPMKKLEGLFDFYNRKLTLFYNVSVPSESMSSEVLQTVRNAITKAQSPRSVLELAESHESYIAKLARTHLSYNPDSMDENIDEFNRLLEMDTSGFLTKHDSKALEQQVAGLEDIYSSTVDFYNQHNSVINKINHAIGVVRLVAYRNIYLGAELLNIVHDGAGGGKLTTAFDSIEGPVNLAKSKIKIESFSTSNAISDMISSGLDSISTSVSNVLNDKQTTKYALNNPKTAAIAVAGQAAFAIIDSGIKAWKKRNAKIDGLLKKEERLIKNLEKVVDSYLTNLSSSERALELIKAIIKVNDGFLSIYTPISQKVFIDKSFESVSMTELNKLTLAIGEYKKISDSKL